MPHDPRTSVWTRLLALSRVFALVAITGTLLVAATAALAQDGGTPAPTAAEGSTPAAGATPAAAPPRVTLGGLFAQSFDLFTILLVVGSLAAWYIIILCIIEIREKNIAPPEPEQIIAGLARSGRYAELKQFVGEDKAFVSKVVRAAMAQPSDEKNAVRDAAELAASEQCARWFRRIEPLNVIGNLGPLLGLAGTVWGMIIAFAELGQAGGQASPANLSVGIAKALFHTLLGLMLAVPCLTIFGFYRTKVDRLCNRAMAASAELVELLPADSKLRGVDDGKANGQPRPPQSRPVPTPRVGP
jgi:biopolymer transport protein ExbB